MRAAASHTPARWGHPGWCRSSVGWSRASERRKVPLERKIGSCLRRAGASVAAESGMAETVIFVGLDARMFWQHYLASLESPPECPCAAGRSGLPLPPV